MKELVFVTGNTKKAEEAAAILPFPLSIHALDLDEIQSLDSHKIVHHKAKHAYEIIKAPLFVDDVSLSIHAWNRYPGPLVKFLLQDGNGLFLRLLKHESDRRAELSATIAYHDGKNIHTFQGILEGTIAKIPTGGDGWGFDPIFIPKGSEKTFAEMTKTEKNKLSHRKKALTLFADFLSHISPF